MITRYLAVTLIFRFRLYRRALFHCLLPITVRVTDIKQQILEH